MVSVVLHEVFFNFGVLFLSDVKIPRSKLQAIQIAYYYFISSQFQENIKVFKKYLKSLSLNNVWGDCYRKLSQFKTATYILMLIF